MDEDLRITVYHETGESAGFAAYRFTPKPRGREELNQFVAWLDGGALRTNEAIFAHGDTHAQAMDKVLQKYRALTR